MTDFKSKGMAEIEHRKLADAGILSFILVNCWVPRVALAKLSWDNFLKVVSEAWIIKFLSSLLNCKRDLSTFSLLNQSFEMILTSL